MKRKKIISLLLSALMLVTMFSGMQITASAATWSGKAASSFAGGKGTKSSPYIIKTGEQLARMRNLIKRQIAVTRVIVVRPYQGIYAVPV